MTPGQGARNAAKSAFTKDPKTEKQMRMLAQLLANESGIASGAMVNR